jgi:hypothetical protein
MRELHEGIDLLPHERAEDPFVWRNIDRWTQRCSQIVSWIDTTAQRQSSSTELTAQRQFVCGTDWAKFREVLDKYQQWLYEQYGGKTKVKQQLVFAHNDVSFPSTPSFTYADLLDSIRKSAANGAVWGVASAAPSKPTQATCGHRFRIRECQPTRPRICKPFCKSRIDVHLSTC